MAAGRGGWHQARLDLAAWGLGSAGGQLRRKVKDLRWLGAYGCTPPHTASTFPAQPALGFLQRLEELRPQTALWRGGAYGGTCASVKQACAE